MVATQRVACRIQHLDKVFANRGHVVRLRAVGLDHRRSRRDQLHIHGLRAPTACDHGIFRNVVVPAGKAAAGRNTSSPFSLAMKPYPLAASNQRTRPVGIAHSRFLSRKNINRFILAQVPYGYQMASPTAAHSAHPDLATPGPLPAWPDTDGNRKQPRQGGHWLDTRVT